MKNKNLVLMAVAIGCGLVAAFLVAKLGAKSATPQQDLVQVIVAKKDINIGTKIDEKDFDELLTIAALPRQSVPPDVITDPALLKGKRAARTLRTGNYFAPNDVSNKTGIEVPKGMQSFSIRMDAVRAVTGFVFPGDEVDILAMIPTRKDPNRKNSARILVRMLVTAVDIQDRRPEGGGTANPTIQAVTLAVTPEQAKLLHTAEAGGGDMRLVLRPQDYVPTDGDKPDPIVSIDDENKQINEQKAPEKKETPPTPMETVVYVKKDIAPNTKINDENLNEYFEMKSILAPAPSKAVRDLSKLTDKFIVIQQAADFPLMESAVAEKELPPDTKIVEVIKEVVVEKKVEVPVEKKPEPKKTVVKHEISIVGPTGREDKFLYEGTTSKDLKRVEESNATKNDEKFEVKPLEKAPEEKPAEKPVTPMGERPI